MISNKQVIGDVLLQAASEDKDIVVLCSDSRGSGSMTEFAERFPGQFVETGSAEQDLVGISAGLASCGKKVFAVSPASFLTTRSMEQIKVDVAYSHVNVKLIGVSGGISYGALGMTHHSVNDISVIGSIPGMRVFLPSDPVQTRCLMEALLQDEEPAYIRVGRNPVPALYGEESVPFAFNKAAVLQEGNDLAVIACGELVKVAQLAGKKLKEEGVSTRVLDMYCVKPIDEEAIGKAASECRAILTLEEHVGWGGLGSCVARIVCASCPCPVHSLHLPDRPVVSGSQSQVFDYYGLNVEGVLKGARMLLEKVR